MFKIDWWLFGSSLVLVALGLLVLFSVAPADLGRQIGFVALGLLGFFSVSLTDYRLFAALPAWLYGGSLILLLATDFFGSPIRGATRWLTFGSWQIQTAEVIKPLLILAFAAWLSRLSSWKLLPGLTLLLGLVLPVILVFRQPDLGSSLVILSGGAGQIFAAGFPLGAMLVGIFGMGLAAPLLWGWLRDYQRLRLISFLNPQTDPLRSGYNAIQAMIAVGSGQLLGRGLGHGTQSQLKFLPERQTDFIFASLAEELGFVGSLLVMVLFFVLLLRTLLVARLAPDKFGYLLSLGVFASLASSVLINLGMNLGLVPVTGITLPLMSVGGSSMVATFILLGLANSVAARARPASPLVIRSMV